MLFGNIRHVEADKSYPQAIQDILKFIRGTDFSTLESGNYEIDGKNLWYLILDVKTEEFNNNKPEIHKEYIDIQYLLNGEEYIGVTADTGNYTVKEDLSEENDIVYYDTVDNETRLRMTPGSFVVLFPWDVHRPACCVNNPMKIQKVVFKLKLDQI